VGRKQGGRYQRLRRLEDGTAQKYCAGPLHRLANGDGKYHIGGTWVDVAEFRMQKSGRMEGRLRAWCKACESYQALGRQAMNVPRSLVAFAVEELVRRLGIMETARRLFKSQQWIYQFRNQRIASVRYDTAVDIVQLLAEVRAKDEVRSRRSIRRGSHMRGEDESPPAHVRDYYRPQGDLDNERERQSRKRTGR